MIPKPTIYEAKLAAAHGVPLNPDPLYTNAGAAEYIGVSGVSLEKDRWKRQYGIPFLRIGKAIRYRKSDLDAFLASCVCRSTSEYSARSAEPHTAAA